MISLFGKNEPEPTLLEKLKASVSKTKAVLSETVDTIFLGERKIDPSLLKHLETALLSADLGVKTTREILDAVREKMDRNALADAAQLKREIPIGRFGEERDLDGPLLLLASNAGRYITGATIVADGGQVVALRT